MIQIFNVKLERRIRAGLIGLNGTTIVYPISNQPYVNPYQPSNDAFRANTIPQVNLNNNPQVTPVQTYNQYYNPIKY